MHNIARLRGVMLLQSFCNQPHTHSNSNLRLTSALSIHDANFQSVGPLFELLASQTSEFDTVDS